MSEADSIQRQLGSRIRQIRRRQQLTQAQLAARAGRSHKFLGEIERGKANPTVGVVAEVARALGVSLSHLFSTPQSGAADVRMLSGWDVRRVEEAVATLSTYFRGRPPRRRMR